MSNPIKAQPSNAPKDTSQMLGESAFQSASGGQSRVAPAFELKVGDGANEKSGTSVSTWGGDFMAKKLFAINAQETKAKVADEMVGLHMELHFAPGENVDSTEIAMLQTAKTVKAGEPILWYPTDEARGIPIHEEGGGTKIDASEESRSPLYGVDVTPNTDQKLSDSPVSNPGYGEHGYHYESENGKPLSKNAVLMDLPGFRKPTKNAQQTFESTALAIKGNQEGTYYGSVSWGWETDEQGRFKILPFTKVSDGTPGRNFLAAANRWNQTTNNRLSKDIPLPVPGKVLTVVDAIALMDAATSGAAFHQLKPGTRLEDLGERSNGMAKVKVIDGGDNHGLTYQSGWVSESMLSNEN